MELIDGFAGWFNDFLIWILNLVQDVHPAVRTFLAGFGIMLETSILIGLLIPGDTIVVVASTAIDTPAQFIAMILAVILGALTGESIGFALGRYFGPKIRASRLGRSIGERNWRRAQNYLDRRGGIAVFISRFLPVLHSLIPVTVGMSTMSYRRFIAWTVPACVIWTTAYVSVGTFAAGSFRDLLERLHYAGYVFAGILILFAIGTLVVKKLLERSEERHMERPGDGDANTIDDRLFDRRSAAPPSED